jgi:uncharacterized membrane protein
MAAAVLVAVALRAPYLTSRSIWFDEAASWQQAKVPLMELPGRLRFDTVLPPFFVMLKAWMAAFGESILSLRSFSLLFGALTVAGMYLLGIELYPLSRASGQVIASGSKRRARAEARGFALTLALLVAVSPFQINGAIEVRLYARVTAVAAFAGWALLRALRGESDCRRWILYGSLAGLSLWLHPFELFVVASQFAFLSGLAVVRYGRRMRRLAFALLSRSMAAGASAAVVFLPALAMLLAQHRRVHAGFWIGPLSIEQVARAATEFVLPVWPGSSFDPLSVLAVAALSLCVVAATVAYRGRGGDWLTAACALLPLALAACASLKTPVFIGRYFRFSHLYLLALVALAVWRATRALPRLRLLASTLLIAAGGCGALAFWSLKEIENRPGMRGAMARILALRKADEMLISDTQLHFLPATYYAPQGVPVKIAKSAVDSAWAQAFISREDTISDEVVALALKNGIWFISQSDIEHQRASFVLPSLHRALVIERFTLHYDHGAPDWPICVSHCRAPHDSAAPSQANSPTSKDKTAQKGTQNDVKP